MSRPRHPPAPAHLSDESKKFWRRVVREYELADHELKLLRAALEAWDRYQEARAVIAKEGITVPMAGGSLKAHPAVAIERDARLAFARLLRELDLEGEPAPDPRPPRIRGRYDRDD